MTLAAAAAAVSALLTASGPGPGIESVTTEPATGGTTAVRIVLAGAQVPATVRREGARIVVAVPGGPPELLALPRPRPPVEAVLSEPSSEGGLLVLEVRPPFEYKAEREGRELRVVLAPISGADDLETLTRMLFPAVGGAAPVTEELPLMSRGPRVRLRPSVGAFYATGTNAFEEGPQPGEDSYWDVAPRLELLTAPARIFYEAHIRGGSRYPDVNSTTTHEVGARVERHLAGDAHVSLQYDFLRGRQQARAVDPGGEYFFGLEPFRKQGLAGRGRFPVGGATGLLLNGTWEQVRFDRLGTFIDYSYYTLQGGVRREVGGQSSVEVLYTRDDVYDATSAAVAGTSADTVSASLTGEVRPMLDVHFFAGLTRRRSPGAPDAARTLTDLVARVELRKEFSGTTAVSLACQRSPTISAFEANPSYLSNFVEARGYAGLPAELSLAVSAGYRQNDYPLNAEAIGAPRRDRIFGWAVGLGRTIGSHAVLHVEYRWLRRRSNLPELSSVADGLLIQLDVTAWRRETGP